MPALAWQGSRSDEHLTAATDIHEFGYWQMTPSGEGWTVALIDEDALRRADNTGWTDLGFFPHPEDAQKAAQTHEDAHTPSAGPTLDSRRSPSRKALTP